MIQTSKHGGENITHKITSKARIVVPLAFLLISHSILSFKQNQVNAARGTSLTFHKNSHLLYNEQPMLNLSQVYVIYSNVFVVDRTDTSENVRFIIKGPYKQVAWLVLTSPWKPIYIISNNTEQHFIELSYDPKTMPTNPIANTTDQYAWDYDQDNQVIFIKLLLTSAVKVSIYYGVPSAPNWITWILIALLVIAIISIIAFNRYRKTKVKVKSMYGACAFQSVTVSSFLQHSKSLLSCN